MVIGYDDKGLPKTKNVLAKTKAECEKKLKNLIAAQKESEPQLPQQTMTVAQWLDFWYQTYKKPNLRPNTQMSYELRKLVGYSPWGHKESHTTERLHFHFSLSL